jgi:hypothetical protein
MGKEGLGEMEAVSPQPSHQARTKEHVVIRIKVLPSIRGFGAGDWKTLNSLFLTQAPPRHVERVELSSFLSFYLSQLHKTSSLACSLLIPTS